MNMSHSTDKENTNSGIFNSNGSFQLFDENSLRIYTKNMGTEKATPKEVLEERKTNQNKSEPKDKEENPSNNILDGLEGSFLIKNEENDKAIDEEEFGEAKEFLDPVNLTQGLISQWVDFFRSYEEKVFKVNLRKLYAEFMTKQSFWENYLKQYPHAYYNVHYLVSFIQCQSYLLEEALPTLEKMEEFYNKNEKTLDLGPADLEFFYAELANCYSNLGKLERADTYFDKASQFIEKKVMGKIHVTAYYFVMLGQHFLRYGNPDKALDSFRQCLRVLENLPDEDDLKPAQVLLLAWCYIDISDAYIAKGNQDSYTEAEKFLEQAVEKFKLIKNEELHFMARVERNYGQIYEKRGDKFKAMHHYNDALEILNKTMPEKCFLTQQYADEQRKILEDI